MGINLNKKAPAAPKSTHAEQPAAEQKETQSKQGMSFLRRGAKAKDAFQHEEVKAEMKSKNANNRFYMKNGGETKITFLDGEIKDGMFDIPFFYQHSIPMNGKYQNFVCTQDEEPCPICEGGHEPSYVGVMSVIDHGGWTSKFDGLHKNEVKMFVAKRNTIKALLKEAIKRGGLTGCEFDVSRTGDKEAGVGNVFSFNEKYPLPVLKQKYGGVVKGVNGGKAQVIAPMKYDEEIQFMPASELRKLHFGSTQNAPIGSEAQPNFESEM